MAMDHEGLLVFFLSLMEAPTTLPHYTPKALTMVVYRAVYEGHFKYTAASISSAVLFVGVLVIRVLLVAVCTRAPDF